VFYVLHNSEQAIFFVQTFVKEQCSEGYLLHMEQHPSAAWLRFVHTKTTYGPPSLSAGTSTYLPLPRQIYRLQTNANRFKELSPQYGNGDVLLDSLCKP
jgi:hypothetical protein